MHPAAGSLSLGAAMFLLAGGLEPAAAQTTACSLLSRAEVAEILGKPAIATAGASKLPSRGTP